jgi:hypothetical protein
MDMYFEIFMPSNKVKRAKDKRYIQVHSQEPSGLLI